MYAHRGFLATTQSRECLHSPAGFSDNSKSVATRYNTAGVPLSVWLSALRDRKSMRHATAVHAWDSFGTGANGFVTPQVDYLRGVQHCNGITTEVHFLCTESLRADWEALLRQQRRAGLLGAPDARRARRNRVPETGRYVRSLQNHSYFHGQWAKVWSMSEADRDFVRRCLFPADTALHATVCSSRLPAGTRGARPTSYVMAPLTRCVREAPPMRPAAGSSAEARARTRVARLKAAREKFGRRRPRQDRQQGWLSTAWASLRSLTAASAATLQAAG